MTNRKQKVSILTLGCSKNVVDSEGILSQFLANNFIFEEDYHRSDIVVVNTCGFIKSAKEESIGAILHLAGLRKQGKIKKLIVAGCLSERYQQEMVEQIHHVDHFLGVNSAAEIMRIAGGDYRHGLLGESRLLTPNHYTYIKISDGCNHPCSFCAIPLIKGAYRSRPESEIIEEVSNLAEKGTKEFILIGQDTTYFGNDIYNSKTLPGLIDKLASIKGVDWLRLMYTYPTAFPHDLLDVMASHSNICKYIDIPLQHISDSVLKSMKRGINRRIIEQLLTTIREKIPGVRIRSTFIVGYPNETDQDFQELADFITVTQLDRVGVFTYSPEEGTSAFELGDPIPQEAKNERRAALMEIQRDISLQKNRDLIGKKLNVLIDEANGKKYTGRTEYDAPDVDNSVIISSYKKLTPGEFYPVEITGASEYDLIGNSVASG